MSKVKKHTDKKWVIACPPDGNKTLSHPRIYLDLTHNQTCPYCGTRYEKHTT